MKGFRKGARGQAIVIIALGMVALLGFVALAIDGGRFYWERRQAQNAADAASRKAAAFYCEDTSTTSYNDLVTLAAQKAAEMAAQFGFNNTKPNQITTVVTPIQGGARFSTTIYTQIPTGIAGIQGIESLAVSATGIATCQKISYRADLAAIVALANSSQCGNALQVSGSQAIISSTVTNGEAQLTNSSGSYEQVFYGDGVSLSPGVTVTNGSTKLAYPITLTYPDIVPYAYGGSKALAAGPDYHYYSGDINLNKLTTPFKGIYYSENGNITGNNISVDPAGATFIAAHGDIQMSATNTTIKPYNGDQILLYSGKVNKNCGSSDISISSNTTVWTGEIWAVGNVKFSDKGNSTENGGIFAFTIQISASNTQILRNPGEKLQIPPYWYESK